MSNATEHLTLLRPLNNSFMWSHVIMLPVMRLHDRRAFSVRVRRHGTIAVSGVHHVVSYMPNRVISGRINLQIDSVLLALRYLYL